MKAAASATLNKKVKKKDSISFSKRLLLCVGYSGNGVSGSQYQRNVPVEKTIEGKLIKYMLDVGLLNIKPLPKQHEHDNTKKQEYYTNLRLDMDWNASSRTDKGVHSIANIFSCRVPDNINEDNNDWISELNSTFSSAEESLRVFHLETIKEDAEKFNARKFGLWRTYEYFIPQYCLKGMISASQTSLSQKIAKKSSVVTLPDINLEAVCKQLNNVFSKMEGFKNFQNFTSSTLSNGSGEGGQEDDLDTFQNSDTVGNQFYRTVFQCTAKPYTIGVPHFKLYNAGSIPLSTTETLKGVLVKVTASGFLYHQIRKMIGLAISHVIFPKDINDEFIDIAINSKERMFIPTAPGDSLVLLHTALRDSALESRIYGGNSSKRPEFIDGCTNKEMEQYRTHQLYPEILMETPASFRHVQSYLSDKKQEERKNQKSSWIQLAHELRFYLKDLIEQKESVKSRAKKQIEEGKKRDEWKKKEERERRSKMTIGDNTELLPSGYKLHFYIKFKCLPNEEKSIRSLKLLEKLYRSKEIPIEETNFEIIDKILSSKQVNL